jgi:hypothetical protein
MRAVVTVLVVCALFPLIAACEPRTVTDSAATIYCEVTPEAPERDNDDAPKKIIGAVRYRCVEPGASSLQVTLRLQRQGANGQWSDLAQTTFTASGSATVPERHEAFRTREISANCREGVFRTVVTGRSRARSTTKTYDRTSPRSFDPCRPGLFAS